MAISTKVQRIFTLQRFIVASLSYFCFTVTLSGTIFMTAVIWFQFFIHFLLHELKKDEFCFCLIFMMIFLFLLQSAEINDTYQKTTIAVIVFVSRILFRLNNKNRNF